MHEVTEESNAYFFIQEKADYNHKASTTLFDSLGTLLLVN